MIFFAADIHLGAGDARQARRTELLFDRWLDEVAPQAEAIYLLGDVFDFWFEYRRVVPKGHVRTLGRLAAWSDRGVKIVFLTGNHDMWVGDYLRSECGIEVRTEPGVVEHAGKRIFVAHGDNMNIAHLPVLRFMNAVFRSRTLRWLFSWLVHPDLAVCFGRWWSGKSRKGHACLPLSEGDNPLVGYARDHSDAHPEIDCYVFGHMHWPSQSVAGHARVVNLGCWGEEGSYAVLDDAGRLTLKKYPE